MSATLPNFNQLKLESSSNLEYSNISLIENSEKYFDHILFNRTQIQNEISSFTLNKEDFDMDSYNEFSKDFWINNAKVVEYKEK